jgi:hypothetical protein
MLRQCSAISFLLLTASVVSRVAVETSERPTATAARKLVERALHWTSVADADADADGGGGGDRLNVYHHLVTALAFLYAAREIATDRELERVTGVDVVSSVTTLERRVARLHQNCSMVDTKR